MRLVFVHGWGFDAALWDGVASALADHAQCRVDLGFLADGTTIPQAAPDDVLIGHSLGFLWGMGRQDWRRVIAINGFARFAGLPEEGACVRPAALRALRLGLARDPAEALEKFYRSIDHAAPSDRYDAQHLAAGLALLESRHLTQPLGVPCAILAARHDPLVPVTATEHLAALAGAEVTWSEEGGHLLPLTRAQWCADAIRAYLP